MADDPMLNGQPISALKVVELRKELEVRGLSKSGVKKELYERLRDHLTRAGATTAPADLDVDAAAPTSARSSASPRKESPSVSADAGRRWHLGRAAFLQKQVAPVNKFVAQYLQNQQATLQEAARRESDASAAAAPSENVPKAATPPLADSSAAAASAPKPASSSTAAGESPSSAIEASKSPSPSKKPTAGGMEKSASPEPAIETSASVVETSPAAQAAAIEKPAASKDSIAPIAEPHAPTAATESANSEAENAEVESAMEIDAKADLNMENEDASMPEQGEKLRALNQSNSMIIIFAVEATGNTQDTDVDMPEQKSEEKVCALERAHKLTCPKCQSKIVARNPCIAKLFMRKSICVQI